MNFKKWLAEAGGGIEPVLQSPTGYQGAFSDFHGKDGSDPKNQDGQLPPVPKKSKKRNINSEKK